MFLCDFIINYNKHFTTSAFFGFIIVKAIIESFRKTVAVDCYNAH